ncbi:MAG: caspase family protein [Bacteroidales bacterium]|nr:caspase family protein [Bacteroidales bacterium]
MKIYINNLKDRPVPDTIPPSISLISPEVEPGGIYDATGDKLVLIGQVHDESLSISLLVNDNTIIPSLKGIFRSEIPLEQNENKISIIALDQYNNLTEYRFTANYNATLANNAKININGEYYALLIANENYLDPNISDLENPPDDAMHFFNVITSEYTFDPQNIVLLNNATRNEIIVELDKFAGKIKPYDNFVLFYAGHGLWDEESNIGYWLPADASTEYKTAWIRNSTIRDYLKEIKAKHILLISDACFGGSIFKTRSVFNNSSYALKMLYELPSRKAMTSGALSEVPDESVFIKYLIERLRNNKNLYMSGQDLFNSLRDAVTNNSRVMPQYGVIMDVGDEGGDFIFLKRSR